MFVPADFHPFEVRGRIMEDEIRHLGVRAVIVPVIGRSLDARNVGILNLIPFLLCVIPIQSTDDREEPLEEGSGGVRHEEFLPGGHQV